MRRFRPLSIRDWFTSGREEVTEDVELEEITAFGGNSDSKLDNNLRFAFQNVNGLRLESSGDRSELAMTIETLGIDIFGMAETNIHWNQEKTAVLSSLLQLVFGTGQIATSSSRTNGDGYLPGGTALIARGCSTGRICHRRGDRMGRFSYMALRGAEGCGVLFISAYRVCQSRGTLAGPDTAFMQQIEALRAQGVHNPDPRDQILDDMTDLISEWTVKGYHPIIGLDANASLDEARFARFLDRNNLIDVVGHVTSGDPPPTYSRGQKRIDFILGDMHVCEAAVQGGSLGMHEGLFSDHTLQFVDFDQKRLFRNETYTPLSVQERQFTLNNSIKKNAFVKKLYEIHSHQRIGDRVVALAQAFSEEGTTQDLVQRYNRLDYEIRCSILAAANTQARKKFGYQWSPALVKAGMMTRLWRSITSSKRRRTQVTASAQQLANLLDMPIEKIDDLGIAACHSNLHAAVRRLRQVQRDDVAERLQWLESLAQEPVVDRPGEDWQLILRRLVTATKSKALHRKLTAILKPERTNLDHVDVPLEQWY